MYIQTKRLIITEFSLEMAEVVHKNSLDDDNKKFVPDEVFETIEDAKSTLEFLIGVYKTGEGPLVYPVLLKDRTNIGYVQLAPIKQGFEIGYHIAKQYTNNGYATEAVNAFLKYITKEKRCYNIYGCCLLDNIASQKVLKKCGFIKQFQGKGLYQGKQREIVSYVFDVQTLS